jgi:FkbM family methyltransferase
MDTFTKLDEAKWSRRMIGGQWVFVPSFEDPNDLEHWEISTYLSMQSLLKPGMLFYEIGAYTGWCDVPITRFVGGAENMVLVEPNPINWPNIKATLEKNSCGIPRATFMGFAGTDEKFLSPVVHNGYPTEPDYGKLMEVCSFRLLDEQGNKDNTACITLDNLVALCGAPDAINVDVEGAALIVLQSATQTLRRYRPMIWVSIHPITLRETTKLLPPEEGVHNYLKQYGYRGTFLGKDHEEHWVYV